MSGFHSVGWIKMAREFRATPMKSLPERGVRGKMVDYKGSPQTAWVASLAWLPFSWLPRRTVQ